MNDPLARVRQCHAIEHATVAVLLERRGGRKMRVAGLSHPEGFLLLSAADSTDVASAAAEALARLSNGEHHLAISDNCGTTIVTGALLTAAVARLALARRGPFSRAVLWSAGALVGSQAVGRELQRRYTTDADVADRAVGKARRLVDTPVGPLVHVALS